MTGYSIDYRGSISWKGRILFIAWQGPILRPTVAFFLNKIGSLSEEVKQQKNEADHSRSPVPRLYSIDVLEHRDNFALLFT
jgi:hypothetical protein